jgi:hypothetical protein
MSLKLTLGFSATTNLGADFSSPPIDTTIQIGNNGISRTYLATGSDNTADLGEVATIGYVLLENLASPILISTPNAPTIEIQGTPGSQTVDYKIVAVQADGAYSAASAAGVTTTANATLDNTNFPRLNWDAVAGASFYRVYRTSTTTTVPSTTGLIADNVTATTLDDTGLAGDSATPPSTAIDNVLLYDADTAYKYQLKGGEPAVFRSNSTVLYYKHSTADVKFKMTILEA